MGTGPDVAVCAPRPHALLLLCSRHPLLRDFGRFHSTIILTKTSLLLTHSSLSFSFSRVYFLSLPFLFVLFSFFGVFSSFVPPTLVPFSLGARVWCVQPLTTRPLPNYHICNPLQIR